MGNMAFSGVGNETEQLKGKKWFCSILIVSPLSYMSKEKQRLAKYIKIYIQLKKQVGLYVSPLLYKSRK